MKVKALNVFTRCHSSSSSHASYSLKESVKEFSTSNRPSFTVKAMYTVNQYLAASSRYWNSFADDSTRAHSYSCRDIVHRIMNWRIAFLIYGRRLNESFQSYQLSPVFFPDCVNWWNVHPTSAFIKANGISLPYCKFVIDVAHSFMNLIQWKRRQKICVVNFRCST